MGPAALAQRRREHEHTEQAVGTVSRGSERTLVALMDGTEAQAEGVFAFVRRHFNTQGTKLVFLLVSTPLDPIQTSRTIEAAQAEAKVALVSQWVRKAQELKLLFDAQAIVLMGDPRAELSLFCNHLKPDALLVPSHGKGILGRLMEGSMADYCAHKCHCSVITVKA